MSFRETGHPDAEAAAVSMCARLVESPNELDQIDRMLERVARFIISDSSRSIAAQRENVSNRRLGISKQNSFDLPFVVADAS